MTDADATTTTPLQVARTSSLLLAAVLALQAAGGLFVPGLYRDNAWVVTAFHGSDLDALLLDVPLLLAALALALRGSLRARMVWIGALYYVGYNDLYYLLGAAFNRFFLFYVAIFVLAAVALVAALVDTDAAGIAAAARAPLPRRAVAGILLGCAGLLAVMWIGQCLASAITGTIPQLVRDAGGAGTHLVAALDLTLEVPPMVLAALWLLRARPWGTVIAGGLLVQGALVVADLVVGAPIQAAAGIPGAWTIVPLWAAMGVAFVTGAVLLLRPLPPGAPVAATAG